MVDLIGAARTGRGASRRRRRSGCAGHELHGEGKRDLGVAVLRMGPTTTCLPADGPDVVVRPSHRAERPPELGNGRPRPSRTALDRPTLSRAAAAGRCAQVQQRDKSSSVRKSGDRSHGRGHLLPTSPWTATAGPGVMVVGRAGLGRRGRGWIASSSRRVSPPRPRRRRAGARLRPRPRRQPWRPRRRAEGRHNDGRAQGTGHVLGVGNQHRAWHHPR